MPRLSAITLRAKIAQLQKQLSATEASKAPAIKKVRALMKKLAVTIDDLREEKSRSRSEGSIERTTSNKTRTVYRKPRAKVPVKYRDDKGNTWTGRGKTPRWLVEAERSGKSRDSFRMT